MPSKKGAIPIIGTPEFAEEFARLERGSMKTRARNFLSRVTETKADRIKVCKYMCCHSLGITIEVNRKIRYYYALEM